MFRRPYTGISRFMLLDCFTGQDGHPNIGWGGAKEEPVSFASRPRLL